MYSSMWLLSTQVTKFRIAECLLVRLFTDAQTLNLPFSLFDLGDISVLQPPHV